MVECMTVHKDGYLWKLLAWGIESEKLTTFPWVFYSVRSVLKVHWGTWLAPKVLRCCNDTAYQWDFSASL